MYLFSPSNITKSLRNPRARTYFGFVSCLVVIGFITFLSAMPVNASILGSIFKGASKTATKLGAEAFSLKATKLAKLVPGKGATLSIRPDGRVDVSLWNAGNLSAQLILQNSDDMTKFIAKGVDEVFVPQELIETRASLFLDQNVHAGTKVNMISDTGDIALLTLRKSEGLSHLAVRVGKNLTFSLEAWKRRALLQQKLMSDLRSRMKVVVLVPKSDQIQRKAYKKAFGRKVSFVSSENELSSTLKKARQRLVVMVGHVEQSKFLLKNAAGEISIDVAVQNVHHVIDQSQSVGLMMGCNVACGTKLSGPTMLIEAIETATALKNGQFSSTPAEFLEILSNSTGGLHVEQDR